MAQTKIHGGLQVQDLSITNSQLAVPDVANPNGILLSKIQDGTILVKADGSVPFTSTVGGVTPSAPGDLATKGYVDGFGSVRASNVVTRETPSGLLDGSNAVFVLSSTPLAGTEHVYVSGLLMDPGASNDYVLTGNTITLAFNLNETDKIRVSYLK